MSAATPGRHTSPWRPVHQSLVFLVRPNGGETAVLIRTIYASNETISTAAQIVTAARVRNGSAWTRMPKGFSARSKKDYRERLRNRSLPRTIKQPPTECQHLINVYCSGSAFHSDFYSRSSFWCLRGRPP